MKGQFLEVNPDHLEGVFEGSVSWTWTFIKKNESDVIGVVNLFLGKVLTDENLLFSSNAPRKRVVAERKFGERIEANFSEPKYTLTLRNLNYSDIFTFTLFVSSNSFDRVKTRENAIKSVEITKVKGMFF